MSAALTFGSVGDILAICQIAVKLGSALKGAAAEYLELCETLDDFSRVLLHVVATYKPRSQAPASLICLERDIEAAVHECGGLIRATLDKVTGRYSESLSQGGSGNKVKDAYKKIEFTFREKNDLTSLRKKLSETTANLSLLSSLAARQLAVMDTAAILDRIDHTGREISLRQDQAQERLQNIVVSSQGACAALGVIRVLLEQLVQGMAGLPELLFGLIALNSLRLDPTRSLPAQIEDAMGNLLELPLDWSLEWQDFDYMLERHFEKRDLKGIKKVRKKQYALEEHCSGRDLDRSRPLTKWLRRGMKVNMSMVFRVTKQELTRSRCPRCYTTVVATEGRTVRCKIAECGMWFRVSESQYVEEKNDQDDDQDASSMGAVFRDGDVQGETTNGAASRKTHAADCEPADFQRVRLLTVPRTLHTDDVLNNLQASSIFHFAGYEQSDPALLASKGSDSGSQAPLPGRSEDETAASAAWSTASVDHTVRQGGRKSLSGLIRLRRIAPAVNSVPTSAGYGDASYASASSIHPPYAATSQARYESIGRYAPGLMQPAFTFASDADSYAFPATHSTSSSVYYGDTESVASRTLPRPQGLMGAQVPPAPQSIIGQFSSEVSSGTQKKHKCKVCDKRFTRPSSLQTHMYSHTGEKPFQCEVKGCGRHFSVASNLRRHREVHKDDARSEASFKDYHSD